MHSERRVDVFAMVSCLRCFRQLDFSLDHVKEFIGCQRRLRSFLRYHHAASFTVTKRSEVS